MAINGINAAHIAQASLKPLDAVLNNFDAFTTNFNSDVADKGESVTTRVADVVTAGDATSGYSATAVNSTAVTVSLSNHIHYTMGFTDLEVAKGGLAMLEDAFVAPAVNSIAKKLHADLMALVTNANFSNSTTVTAANFGSDDVADAAKNLTTQNVPKENRTLILNPAYYAALAKDSAVNSYLNFGSADAIRNNEIPMVHGMKILEDASLPDNSENLEAVATGKDALLIAARVPAMPQDWAGSAENVSADNGLTLQWRSYYDAGNGKQMYTATLIYGVAKGQANSLHRIVSA